MDRIKSKVQNADWWEIGYLIIYGAIFTFEFLNTTMFEIQWPPRFGYIFLAASALYTIAKFIWHNTYTKKEMILSAVVLFAFIMPAILTDYSFLFWVGFLIVGAKDVDFDKILKVYLTIGITIMLAAFLASQVGWIENLQYYAQRDGQMIIRNSYGSIYPTDFAAHVFYLAIAGICLAENKLTWGKIINFVILALFVYDKCGARTSFLCLMIMAIALIFIYLLKKRLKRNWIYYIVNMSMVVFAGLYIGLTHTYHHTKDWMVKINDILSGRLLITKQAVDIYNYRLFGQTIVENGWGRGNATDEYFFLDDSYIRIALLYGVVLLLVTMIIFFICGLKVIKYKHIIILCAIAVIGLHSFMEHHLLEVAYNPITLVLFASLTKEEQSDRREICIEKKVKAGSSIGTSF